MSHVSNSVKSSNVSWPLDAESISDFKGIAARFESGFHDFIADRKRQAAEDALRREFGDVHAEDKRLVEAVSRRIENDSIIESRFSFISLNPEYLNTIKQEQREPALQS